MSDTRQQASPVQQSGDDVLITHLICTTCQGPSRPGATAMCGHVLTIGKVPKNRRKQLCVVCDVLHAQHVVDHE